MEHHNPLLKIQEFGQSIWQDYIRRRLITSGDLRRLIEEDGLRGVTSNPKIFDKVIAGSHDYDDDIRAMALDGKTIREIYQALTVRDVQMGADQFRPLYDRSDGAHGYVSLEVNPHLAHDTEGTIREARELWRALDRPNVFIKVPATEAGLPAIRHLISEGINVNVTLLFGLPRYREVADAYVKGLEDRAARGKALERIASVASFFLSRIDVLIDPQLEKTARQDSPNKALAQKCLGQVAIASARQAYGIYKQIFHGERFREMGDRGGRPQRVLWASTSTKNPGYSDVKYVEALIGPETVNTLPQETLDAYRDHGRPEPRLEKSPQEARDILQHLAELDIDIDAVTQQLVDEGVEKFNKPYDSLMDTLRKARADALAEPVDPQVIEPKPYLVVPETHRRKAENRLDELKKMNFAGRLWHKDPDLWSSDADARRQIGNSLGWLHVAEKMEANVYELDAFRAEVREAGFRHVVHMGMGGSSLAPLVFQRTFAPGENGLALTVLDTTDPVTIRDIEQRVPLSDTLFIIASKSGTTTEPLAFGEYFFKRITALKGRAAGENFVAITDPGSHLADLARERGYRRTFLNFEDIGGRYSALSYFGLVPAALMGLDVGELLVRALRMRHACEAAVPLEDNPGVALGAALGELARGGRDKVTFIMPPAVETLGMWLEQLLAESTGKQGKGLLPVAGEPVGHPSLYGRDRVFIHTRLAGALDERVERSVAGLKKAGHPVVTIEMGDRMDLGQEFLRWEIATATAGAVLAINPFDQPNVQESKENTSRLLKAAEETGGRLAEDDPSLVEGSLSLYGREEMKAESVAEALAGFFGRGENDGDYIALLAYLTEETAVDHTLAGIRQLLQQHYRSATTAGYGPRYLHSTGQFHKGGTNTGIFVQFTADAPEDVDVPEKGYTFGTLRKAQAVGDLEALHRHGRRTLRVDLGPDAGKGLIAFQKALRMALIRH